MSSKAVIRNIRQKSELNFPVTLIFLITLVGLTQEAKADHKSGACAKTSGLMSMACYAESRDDYYVGLAKCMNEKEAPERQDCRADVRESFAETNEECEEQLEARHDVCDALGEKPYDPEFEPEDFETDLANLTTPNPYFPMAVGHHWMLSDGEETIDIEIRNEIKLVDDVNCFVVQDVVSVEGDLVEDTDDWFAHALDGAIWYCGEEAKDYEFFDGDVPRLPELVSIDGSFKVERDGARAGVSFPANPTVGDTYRQEFLLGEAEDVAEVVSINYSFGSDPQLDMHVPADLANLLCNDDCVVVREYSALEPGHFGFKYYARGIGFFLETSPDNDVAMQLIACNFSALCDQLPDL